MSTIPLVSSKDVDHESANYDDSDRVVSHLVFRVDEQPYACPITPIRRLLRLSDGTLSPSRPDAPAWEVGRLIIEEEGEDIPLLSLRAAWHLPPRPDAGSERQALLVLELNGKRLALLVDECLRVLPSLPAESTHFHLPTRLKGTHGAAFNTVIPWETSLLVILNFERLMQASTLGTPCSVATAVESQ